MQQVDTARVLRAALVKHSRLTNVSIDDEHRLDAELGLDSFALLDAILDVEDQLEVEVEQSRLVDLRQMRFSELVALLDEMRASGSADESTAAGGAT